MAKKAFYLIRRKDRLTQGKPTYYARFRDSKGVFLPWKSTGETSKTRAELWAQERLGESIDRRENVSLASYVEGFWDSDSTFAQGRFAHGFTLTNTYLEISEGYTRNHLVPAWGSYRLHDLTPGTVDAWIVRLRKIGKLAPATINKLLQTLRTVLGHAVAEGYLVENPAAFVKPIRVERKAPGILTPHEVVDLLSSPEPWSDHRQWTINLLAATTGMRMGEIRGLLVENVKADHVEIRQSWEQGHGLKEPKYGSVRDVPISDLVAGALNRVIQEDAPESIVFYSTAGKDRPMSKSCIEKNLYRAIVALQLSPDEMKDREKREAALKAVHDRGITFHSHRHFLNTLLRSRGVPDSKVRQITGHRSVQMSDWYTHYRAEDFLEVVAVQEELLPQGPTL